MAKEITVPKSPMILVAVKNKYKVSAGIWRSLTTSTSKKVYNKVYENAINNQEFIMNPKQKKLSHDQWTTIVHNMACYAAWAVRDIECERGGINGRY